MIHTRPAPPRCLPPAALSTQKEKSKFPLRKHSGLGIMAGVFSLGLNFFMCLCHLWTDLSPSCKRDIYRTGSCWIWVVTQRINSLIWEFLFLALIPPHTYFIFIIVWLLIHLFIYFYVHACEHVCIYLWEYNLCRCGLCARVCAGTCTGGNQKTLWVPYTVMLHPVPLSLLMNLEPCCIQWAPYLCPTQHLCSQCMCSHTQTF